MMLRRPAPRLTAALMSLTARALADDTGDLEALLERPVVSTASQRPEEGAVSPATSTTISADDLRRHGIRTLDEAINFLSLGMVSTNPLHSVEVGARGVLINADYGNHLLVLVNGHVLNEQWNGTAYYERGLGVPIELIDRVEIVLGPGSVLFGSNAMLGVIQVFTKRARDYRGVHVIAEGEIATSGRLALGFGREGTLFGVPVELTAQLEYFAHKGPTFTFGPQRYGDDAVTGEPKRFEFGQPGTGVWGGAATSSYYTRAPSAFVRAVAGPLELNARALSYLRATPYVNNFNMLSGAFNHDGNNERDDFFSFDLRYRKTLSSVVDLSVRGYADIYRYALSSRSPAPEDCGNDSPEGCKNVLLGGSVWGGLEPQLRFDWARDGRHTTLVGADGRLRQYEGSTKATSLTSGAETVFVEPYKKTEPVLGVYLQQTARLVDPLSLNGGARLDVDPRFGSAVSPRAAAALSPYDGATLKVVYAEAFRAPSGYEQSYFDPTFQLQAEGLSAERVRSIEASFEQRFGAHRLFFGGFRTWWRNMLSLEALSDAEVTRAIGDGRLDASSTAAYQYRNVAAIDNFGWNAAYEGAFVARRLRLGLNATGAYADREGDDLDQPLTVTPRVFGNARVAYDLGEALPVLALAGQLSGPAWADRAFDGGFTPRPRTSGQLMLRATVSGDVPRVKGLSYRFTAHWARNDRAPYVAGPIQAATPAHPSAELAPVDTFRTALGLAYTFDP